MPTIPKFRVFTSDLGFGTSVGLYTSSGDLPNGGKVLDNTCIEIDHKSFVRIYWMLYSITIDYTYHVNDFKVQKTLTIDTSEYTLKNRILGDNWRLEKNIEGTEDLPISTSFGFYPCYPSSSLSKEILICSTAHEEALKICPLLNRYGYNYTPDLPLRFPFHFEECADNYDFSLVSEGYKKISFTSETIQDEFEAKFLKYPVKFYFRTQFPQEIKGHIDDIKITPIFYTIEE